MADDPSAPPQEPPNEGEEALSADVPPSEPRAETGPEMAQPPEEFRDEGSAGEEQVVAAGPTEPVGDTEGAEQGGTSAPEALSVDMMSTGDPTELEDMENAVGVLEEGDDTSQADQDEADFRAKYGIDEEEFNGEDNSVPEEDDEALPSASAAEMDALIKYLEEEEEGEGDGEEEEEDGQTSPMKVESTVGGGDGDPDASSVLVLGPEHPKMQRFQRALSEHLRRQIFEADCNLRDLENDLKLRKKQRTDLGTNLYSLQHDMLRQTEAVEKIDKDMEKLVERRTRIESETKVAKEELKRVKEDERQEQEKELSLRESVKTLDFTEHVVREAASKYEGEVKSRALVDEKIEKMRVKSEAEKRDQDFYLDKILTHVQHMELINSGIRRQIDAHRDEQKELQTYINEAVTEIEALQIEKLHLQRAWNETISVVRSRDEALEAARQELLKVNEAIRIKETELRSLSKFIMREQESHEKSVLLLRRRRVEERILRSQLAQLEAQNESLQIQLANLAKVKRTVEADLLRANNALFKKQKEVSGPRRTLEKLLREKLRLEDKILDILHEQSGLDKAAAHIRSLIREARDKTRNMEVEVARVENENSMLAVEVERLRADLFRKTSLLSELETRVAAQEKVLAEQAKDISQSERIIQRKTSEVEKLNRKLEKLLHQQGGVELGPVEREIVDLEKQLVTAKEEVNRLQAEWLKRQDDLVRLTNQRDSVLHQSELLRKEVFIMERKRQRLDGEVEAKRNEIAKVRKVTETIRAEIASVNARLHDDRSCHEQMDKDNLLIQAELVGLLKDAEEEARELESEISRLESEKVSLIESLHSAHETNLAWEKKVHLAKELQQSLKREQEGSTSALKMEIHHMQVRYQEVIRAQEKLMGDLERSIDRRERIIHRADMNLKRDQINPKHTKINIQRNFAQMKERNRLLLKEVGDIEAQVKDTMGSIQDLENKLSDASNGLNKVREDIQTLETKIADASVQKHKNLIDLVLRQERYRILESMKYGRYKPTGKTLQEVERALNEVESHAYALIDLTDTIAQEHPEAAIHIKLVKASIAPSLTT